MTIRGLFFGALIAISTIALGMQFFVGLFAENIASACIVFGSTVTTVLYIYWTDVIDTHPLSTITILGFCITTQCGALIAQSAAFVPISASLRDPLYTFGVLAEYQFLAILVHFIYCQFTAATGQSDGVLRRALSWMGFYDLPNAGILWLMGLIGLGVNIVQALIFGSRNVSVFGKFLDSFTFLTWAPFLIPRYIALTNGSYSKRRPTYIALALYALAVAAFGIAANWRVMMFTGVITVVLLYTLSALQNRRALMGSDVKALLAAILLGALAAGPIADLATAMQIARKSRGKVTGIEMIEKTLVTWNEPEKIEAYRAEELRAARYGAYDESYISSPILSRFVETKFHDNALFFAKSLTTEDARQQVRKMSLKFMIGVLPSPLIRFLGIDTDKTKIRFSMGDYLAYLSRGVPLGGYLTGSVFGEGYVIFGILFPIIYAGLCFIIFCALDLLSCRTAAKLAMLSPVAAVTIWPYFLHGITGDSLSDLIKEVTRSTPQAMLIYILLYRAFGILSPRSKR